MLCETCLSVRLEQASVCHISIPIMYSDQNMGGVKTRINCYCIFRERDFVKIIREDNGYAHCA